MLFVRCLLDVCQLFVGNFCLKLSGRFLSCDRRPSICCLNFLCWCCTLSQGLSLNSSICSHMRDSLLHTPFWYCNSSNQTTIVSSLALCSCCLRNFTICCILSCRLLWETLTCQTIFRSSPPFSRIPAACHTHHHKCWTPRGTGTSPSRTSGKECPPSSPGASTKLEGWFHY